MKAPNGSRSFGTLSIQVPRGTAARNTWLEASQAVPQSLRSSSSSQACAAFRPAFS
jgi:hypothetical protein